MKIEDKYFYWGLVAGLAVCLTYLACMILFI